ncbi:MAG: ATP-binding protein [Candidatus Omnitrophota bacterium]|nr:ATP-binding protein [Candidatus Omnitrophota bacterium]
MAGHEKKHNSREIRTLFKDLKEDPFRNFNIAFVLMSVIPLLVFFYLLVVKFFTVNMLVGDTGLILVITVFVALLGYYTGYQIIRKILDKVMFYAASAKTSYSKLQETQQQLIQSAKRAVVGELAGGVAHEVKNPLATISMCVNYMEKKTGLDAEERTEKLKMMKKAVFKADKIICSLLNFSGSDQLELKPCQINDVIKASLDLVGRKINLEHITTSKDLEEDLPPVMIDENQMKQVFINTILNSLQAMPGGGELALRTYKKKLTELRNGIGSRKTDYFRPGDVALVCEVRDTGKGIPEEQAGKVFDPFFTSKPVGEGPGLGLTVISSIVERHKGFIDIESKEGIGTKVVVTLPIPGKV